MGPKSPDGSPPTLADAPSASNRTKKISQRYPNRKDWDRRFWIDWGR